MAKRPAQGRGSGGRVTPSARSSSSSSAGKARVPQAKVSKGDTTTAPRPTAEAEPTPTSGFSLARLFNPAAAAGVPPAERTRPWWGFGDVLLWWFLGNLAVAAVAQLVILPLSGITAGLPAGPGGRMGEGLGHLLSGQPLAVARTAADLPLWLTQGVLQLPLWACFIGGSVFATVRKGFGPVRDLKLALRAVDVPLGLAVGVACQLLLVPLVYRLLFLFTPEQDVSAIARGITDKATSPAAAVLVFVTVGFIAPVAEELFFRGLALQSLLRRFSPLWAVLFSAGFFAAAHGQPILFVGLMPFAIVLAWLVVRFDRLGPAIMAHIGFNLVTAAVLVFKLEPW